MKRLINILRNIGEGFGRTISNITRGVLYVTGMLLGFKYRPNGSWDNRSAATIGWLFLGGMPIGILLMPETFSILTWLAICFTIGALCNLQEAIMYAAYILEEGLDGLVEEGVEGEAI